MSFNVAIIGTGQLGSRYLQGLSSSSTRINIWAYDTSDKSLTHAKNLWNTCDIKSEINATFTNDLKLMPKNLDLTIVSTTADKRPEVMLQFSNFHTTKYWLLEKVLGQNPSDIAVIECIVGASPAWVNCPMYIWPLYERLHHKRLENEPLRAVFSGFNGLACNAIHYIDFVARWNNSEIQSIDISKLNNVWFSAKREGFFEIDGEMNIQYTDGSSLRLDVNRSNSEYSVNLYFGGEHWQVFEGDGYAKESGGDTVVGGVLFQSQLTAPLVDQILHRQSCGLPTLKQSCAQHRPFLGALISHWNSNMPNQLLKLPIT